MNERKYCVYMHKNKINSKVYIGATCSKITDRWGKTGNQYKRQKHFYNDIVKYGWDNYEHIILIDDVNYKEAKEQEKHYIQKYINNCYNKTKGGEQGCVKYATQKDSDDRYKKKINDIVEYGKKHHEELAKKSREYYYKNDRYRQRKIEYQRKYRENHKTLKAEL